MRKRLAFLLVFILMFSIVSFPLKSVLANTLVTAKIADLRGDVFVRRGGGLREFAAFDGMPLAQGDWVRTDTNASAKIVYETGSKTAIGSDTELSIEKLTANEKTSQGSLKRIFSSGSDQISIKLWAGSVWNKVKSLLNIDDEYEVETPTAVMGVRGTLYLVSIDKESGATDSTVMDGIVAVRQNTDQDQSGQEQLVTMGKELEVKSLTAPLPESQDINKEELVGKTEPKLLVQVMTDVTARVNELLDKAKEAQDNYQQSKDMEQIKTALVLSQKSNELAELAQGLVSTVQTSDKAGQVQEILKESNQTLEQVQRNINQVKEDTQQTQTHVIDTAKDAGLSQEQINTIVQEAAATPTPTAVEQPAPIPTPAPAPTTSQPSSSGGSGSDSGSGSAVSRPQLQGAYAVDINLIQLVFDRNIQLGINEADLAANVQVSGVDLTGYSININGNKATIALGDVGWMPLDYSGTVHLNAGVFKDDSGISNSAVDAAVSNAIQLPTLMTGYPNIVNKTSTAVDFAVQFNKDVSVAYVVVPSGTPALSGDQVLAGQSTADYPVFYSASTSVIPGGTEQTFHAANLQGNTSYDIYIMGQDSFGNKMASPAKLSFTTSAPPVIAAGYPKVTILTATSFNLTFKFDKDATAYFVVLPSGSPAPNSLQVAAEQDGAGNWASPASGSTWVLAGTESVPSQITYVPSDQQYDIYVTAKDTMGNYQMAPVKTSIYVSSTPSPAVTVTGSTVTAQCQANATVNLYDSTANLINTATADSNGVVSFANVSNGYYKMSQVINSVETPRVSFSVNPQFLAAGTDQLNNIPQYFTLTFAENISSAVMDTVYGVPEVTFVDGSTYWIGLWNSQNLWSVSLDGVKQLSPNTIAISGDGARTDSLYRAYLCQGTPINNYNSAQRVSGINAILDDTYLNTSTTNLVAGTQFDLNVYRAAQGDGTLLSGIHTVRVRGIPSGLIYNGLPVTFTNGNAAIPVTLGQAGAQTLTVSIDSEPVGVSINLNNVAPGPGGWAQTYAGSAGMDIRKTSDLGYAVAGYALNGSNGNDGYLMKTDGNGNLIWHKYFGGTGNNDYFNSLDITNDQGYILCGSTNTNTTGSAIYLVKTDFNGNEQWEQTFGTTNNNVGYSVKQTSDGGYIIAGVEGATNSDYGGSFYLVKTDASGKKLWEKTYGGEGSARSVRLTSDGGYIITGWTIGTDGTTDVYLVKTDASGNLVWDKTFGNGNTDYGLSGQQTADGGYIVVGSTYMPGATTDDVYLIKTDGSGNAQWTKTFGGTGMDEGYSVQQTADNGYIISGLTDSFGSGGQDAYLIKTDSNGIEQWEKTFGGTGMDQGYSVRQTDNGGYILAGTANFPNNIYLIKTDPDGNIPSQSGVTAITTVASTGTPADFWVTSSSTDLSQTSNSIVAGKTAINANMTVGAFLSHLVKQYTGQQWKVTTAANVSTDAAGFAGATAKAATETLASGDVLTVLSSDGTTLRSYTINLTQPVIAAASGSLANGTVDPSMAVTLTGDTFKQTLAASDFTVNVGSTGLTLSGVTRDSSGQVTLNFTGTANTGTLSIQANASALTGGVASPIIIVNVQ